MNPRVDVRPTQEPESVDVAEHGRTAMPNARELAGPPAKLQSVTVDGLYAKLTVPPTLTEPSTAVSVRPVAETYAAERPAFVNE